MARIRTIKPEFWTSEQVAELSPIARLAFIGMWNFCDDQGVHPASVKTLKMEVFPGDDLTLRDLEGLVWEIKEQKLIIEYPADGKRYWYVTGWHHQKIEKPNKKYPPPPDPGSFSDPSPNGRRGGGEQTPEEGKGRESKGMEGKGGEAASPSGPDAAASAPPPPPSPPVERETPPPAEDPTSVKASGKRGAASRAAAPVTVKIPDTLNTAEFREQWNELLRMKKWRNKEASAIQKSLDKLAAYPVEFALQLVENAIAGSWQGVVFEHTPEKFIRWQQAREIHINQSLADQVYGKQPHHRAAESPDGGGFLDGSRIARLAAQRGHAYHSGQG
jgi:hypothetical protein